MVFIIYYICLFLKNKHKYLFVFLIITQFEGNLDAMKARLGSSWTKVDAKDSNGNTALVEAARFLFYFEILILFVLQMNTIVGDMMVVYRFY